MLRTSNCSLPRKDERLSRPGWLTYSGRFTHISGHPSLSAVGRALDSQISPVKDRRSTTEPGNQPVIKERNVLFPYVDGRRLEAWNDKFTIRSKAYKFMQLQQQRQQLPEVISKAT